MMHFNKPLSPRRSSPPISGSWALLVTMGVLFLGCGPALPPPVVVHADPLAPMTLYPLLPDAQWVYDVDTGGGAPPTLGIFEVTESEGELRTVANNRGVDRQGHTRYGEPMHYRATAEGIAQVGTEAFLLRAPIAVGSQWPALGERTAEVISIDREVEVVAGTYTHCVEVREEGGPDGRVVTTTYCPEVGPVIIESRMDTELTMRRVVTRAELRSYDSGQDAL